MRIVDSLFFLLIFLTISEISSKRTINFVAQFPKGCGFAYIAKKKIMNSLIEELNKVGLIADYKVITSIKFSEFNLLVRDKKGELLLLGTSNYADDQFLPYLQDSKTDKTDFIVKVIERLHKLRII
jgi:hypothetical protein